MFALQAAHDSGLIALQQVTMAQLAFLHNSVSHAVSIVCKIVRVEQARQQMMESNGVSVRSCWPCC